jgi:prepilin-type N-terminal cleavage/methylation domain-containing protein
MWVVLILLFCVKKVIIIIVIILILNNKMCLKNKKINKGYTLVEVVVVISIMAFLSAIIYSSFDVSKAQSRDRQRVSDIVLYKLLLNNISKIMDCIRLI